MITDYVRKDDLISKIISDMQRQNKWPKNFVQELENTLRRIFDGDEMYLASQRGGQVPLTARQKEVLDFIKKYIAENEVAPTLDEIGQALGVKSKATVFEHLEELEERGYISREPNKPRFISIVENKMPASSSLIKSGDNSYFAPDAAFEKAKKSILRATYFDQAQQTFLLSHILAVAKARNISLYLVDHQEKLLVPKIWQGGWKEGQIPRSFAYGEGIAGKVWETGIGYVSQGNVHDDSCYVPSESTRSLKAESLLVVPIIDFRGSFVGIVNLDSYSENQFSKELQEEIEEASNQASKLMSELPLAKYISDKFSIEIFLWLFDMVISKE